MPIPQELLVVWTWPAEKVLEELEKLIEKKGALTVHPIREDIYKNSWSATLNNTWPYCSHSSLLNVLRTLVHEHLRLEKEELQRRINAIDESAQL